MSEIEENGLSGLEQSVVSLVRWIPNGMRGKARVARLVCASMLRRPNVVVETADGISLLAPNLRTSISFNVLINGVYEAHTLRVVDKILKPGGVFLDVGANIGIYSLTASRRVGPQGQVIAIEPSHRIGRYLERNVKANHATNVTIIPRVVAEESCPDVEFFESSSDNFGMGSLDNRFGTEPLIVAADTIDNLLHSLRVSQVDLVKMDIEGFEASALKGAHAMLSGVRAPPIVFEFVDWAESNSKFKPGSAQEVLLQHNYKLFRIEKMGELHSMDLPLVTGGANLLGLPPWMNAPH